MMYCDNQSALHTVFNRVFYERTKHLEIHCYIAREIMLKELMKLLPCTSKDRLVDFFTKPLPPQPFNRLLSKLMMQATCTEEI